MIQLAKTDDELRRCCIVLGQLRPAIAKADFFSRVKSQMASGYHVAYISVDGVVVSVAGFRFGENLAWGKHLYIDDLISDENQRSRAYGGKLLQWLFLYAKANACREIHLDSGVQRFVAHKFYFREGFKIASYHFSMSVSLEEDALEVP